MLSTTIQKNNNRQQHIEIFYHDFEKRVLDLFKFQFSLGANLKEIK